MSRRRCRHCRVVYYGAGVYSQRCAHCGYTFWEYETLDASGDRMRALESQEAHEEWCRK